MQSDNNNHDRMVNGYSLLDVLGSGVFAIAYRAEKAGLEYCVREHRFGKKVDGLDAFKGLDLFQREYDVLRSLDHPQVPKVYDLFEFQDGRDYSLFMVQELVPGECLENIVSREGSLPEERVVDVMLQLTDILKYLHSQNPPVIHRDVKPSNIMLDAKTGKIYLIDFGIVQQKIAKTVGGSTMFGSMGYSAPEVFAGQATTKSDIYSLGPTILKLASGISPEDVLDGLRIEYSDKFEFENPSLGVLVDQLIEVTPELRPKSIDEVADYLQKIKSGKSLARRVDGGFFERFFSRFVPSGLFQYLVRSRPAVAKKELQSGVIVEGQRQLSEKPVFFIEEFDDRYRLHNIDYDGGLYFVDWNKTLLDDGKRHTQDEWINLTKGDKWKLPNLQLVHASVLALYKNRNHFGFSQNKIMKKVIEEVFELDFSKNYPHVSSRMLYKPAGEDVVMHDFGYSTQRDVQCTLVGKDGYILAGCGFDDVVDALLGTRNLSEVGHVYKWIIGLKPYLWRLNMTPDHENLCVAGLSLARENQWFFVSACDIITANRSARGVFVSQEKNAYDYELRVRGSGYRVLMNEKIPRL